MIVLYFSTIDAMYDNIYSISNSICSLDEETLNFIGYDILRETYFVMLEKVGEKYDDRINDMMINHRDRDRKISDNEVLRQQISIYDDEDNINIRKLLYDERTDIKYIEYVQKLTYLYKEFKKTVDIEKRKKLRTKLLRLAKAINGYKANKGITNKEYRELQRKHKIISINVDGGLIDKGLIKIDGRSQRNNNPNTYETQHYKRNKRIFIAIDRLRKYLDKKGYTDDQYAKEHDKMIGTKVNPARTRLKQRSPESINSPIEHYEIDPEKPWNIRKSQQQYRDDGTLR